MTGRSSLTGTGTMLRLVLRRDRIRLPVWVVAIVGVVGFSANAVQSVYGTARDRESYADTIGHSAGSIAMGGPPVGLRTLGGVTVFETSTTALVATALMAIFLTVRHTRAEEEIGRTELLRAGHLGRLAPVFATLLTVGGASVLVGLGSALWFTALGLPVAGSWVYGASVAALGLVFTGVTLVAAQAFEHGRTALGASSAVLAVAFAVRAVGDVSAPGLSWASPVGWSQATHPFEADRWWALLISLAATVVLVAAAVLLVERRDLGAGLVPPRLGSAVASPRLAGSWGLAARLQRSSAVWWTIGLFLGGIAFGSVSGDINGLIEDRPDLRDVLAPEGGSITDGYLSTMLLILALVAGGFTLASTLRLRSEESSGRAEPLLATRLSRLRWAGGSLAFTLVGTTLVLTAAGLGLGLATAVATGDAGQVGRSTAGAVVYLPAALLLASLAVLLIGWLPSAITVTWAVLAGCFVVGYLGQLLEFPQWLVNVSPYTHTPAVLTDGFTVTAPLVLLAVAALLGVAGLAGLRQRDLG